MTTMLNTKTARFARHYLEMVIAMMAGMIVLGVPAEGLLQVAGSSTSDLSDSAPGAVLAGMGVAMTVPMVAWMRYRGHTWRPTAEMAASMILPTIGVLLLLGTGAMTDFHGLMGLLHVVMLPAMLLAMLLRVDEYTHHHAAHAA